MQEFPQSIYPELAELGGFRVLKGTLQESYYDMGGMHLQLPQGQVEYDLTLTNTGEAILLQGTVSTVAKTECARCLEPVTIEVEGEAQGYYLLDPADADEGYEPDEIEVVESDGSFDLSGAVLAALSYATPFVVLCKDDCKGLCPKCGADLNETTCSCADEPDAMNPFAALMGLQFSDEDVARGDAAFNEYGDAVPDFDEEDDLSPEEAAELEKALDAIFGDGAEGFLEFDDEGNLVFIEGEPGEGDEVIHIELVDNDE